MKYILILLVSIFLPFFVQSRTSQRKEYDLKAEHPITISITPINASHAYQSIEGNTLSKPKTLQSHSTIPHKNSDENDEVTSPPKKKTIKKISTTLRPFRIASTPKTNKSRPTRFTTMAHAKVIPVQQIVKPGTVLYSTTSRPMKPISSTTAAALPKPTVANVPSQAETEHHQTSIAAPVLQSTTEVIPPTTHLNL